jgi:hypothetical protein
MNDTGGSNVMTGRRNRRHAGSAARRIGRGLRGSMALLGLSGLAACSQDFSLQPPSGEPMTVSGISTHSIHDIAPAGIYEKATSVNVEVLLR